MIHLLKVTLFVALCVCSLQAYADVYVIEYESYKWNPCSGSVCLAINCPVDGCHVDGKYIICKNESCVTNILDQNGEEHLVGIWAIDYKNKTSQKVEYKKSYKLESRIEKPYPSNLSLYGTAGTVVTIKDADRLIMDNK